MRTLCTLILASIFMFGCGGPDDPVDGSPPPNEACTACAESACVTEMDGCEANPACVAIGGCLRSCQGDDCLSSCMFAHSDGAPVFGTLLSCQLDQCSNECGGGSSSSGSGNKVECNTSAECASHEICLDGFCKS
jgi:hypothetical protein